MKIDTPLIRTLRDHLLEVAPVSIRPARGGHRAASGSEEELALLERFRPFAELFFLVASSDGTVSQSERDVMMGAFRTLTDGRVQRETLVSFLEEMDQRCMRQEVEEQLEAVCTALSGDREDAELAFTLASAVALADKDVVDEELQLVEKLASWMGISSRRRESLVENGRMSMPPSDW